ncbi:hypothetical protein [Pseudomonas sp. CFBP 13719]|uniref:hypothetical protein n=1 Tax=Pseudomonas sp. CFBP 13719 TaxID=2775303 RepID=UPI00177FE76B|nr:hypothetical protein [Pseudomonas sp. CFBP 13719]MBD8681450.1 hypothetical protein [Pseudomonas sp. CFBP 13719]
MTNRSFEATKRAAFDSAVKHQGLKLSFEGFDAYVRECDPTPKGKYQRWLLSSLLQQIETKPFNLDFTDSGISAYKALAWFEDKKRYLPVELRNILSYQSIKEISVVLAEYSYDIDRLSKRVADTLETIEVIEDTRVLEGGGLSIHQPRSIEDLALLWGNDDWLDKRGSNNWARLKAIGTPFVFLNEFGPLLGVLPNVPGHRGLVLDTCTDPGMFEDMLPHHDLSYETDKDIIDLLCKIDPTLPFDEEMEEVGPYLAALNQFPLILHEDRTPSDEILQSLLASTDLSQAARTELEAI